MCIRDRSDPEYAKLSATIQEWAENGTPDEKRCLEYFFEKALREKFINSFETSNTTTDLKPFEPDLTIEKAIKDKLTYSSFEELKETTNSFFDRLFGLVDSAMSKAFEEAEQKGMQLLEKKIAELEEHGIDDMIEAKLATKEPEYEKLVRESFGVENNPEMHLSDLNAYMNRLKKKRQVI